MGAWGTVSRAPLWASGPAICPHRVPGHPRPLSCLGSQAATLPQWAGRRSNRFLPQPQTQVGDRRTLRKPLPGLPHSRACSPISPGWGLRSQGLALVLPDLVTPSTTQGLQTLPADILLFLEPDRHRGRPTSGRPGRCSCLVSSRRQLSAAAPSPPHALCSLVGHVYWWWAVFSLTDTLAPWPLHCPSHVDLHTSLATGPPAPAERQIYCLLCSPCRERAHCSCLINALDFSVHHGDRASYPFLNPLCAPQGSCFGHATSCTGVGGGLGARGRRHPVTSCLATPGPPCVHPVPAKSVCPPVR